MKIQRFTLNKIRRWSSSHTTLMRRKMEMVRINGSMFPWAGADYNNKAEGEE